MEGSQVDTPEPTDEPQYSEKELLSQIEQLEIALSQTAVDKKKYKLLRNAVKEERELRIKLE